MDEIANKCEYPYGYQSVNWDKRYVPFPYWPIRYHFGQILSGQSILSNFPIEQTSTVVLDKPSSRSFITNAFYIDRLVQKAVINLDSGQLMVLNLHLEAFDQETRVAQAKVVKNLYDSLSSQMPVLLMGDFNSTIPGGPYLSEAIEVIMGSEDIESAVDPDQYEANPEEYFTFSSGTPEYMIDFIFYNPSRIEKISSRVVSEMGEVSDHLPVVMEFKLKK
jgi:endonuclease/exonuclease/phosphatase family metal-dependent hydrolase